MSAEILLADDSALSKQLAVVSDALVKIDKVSAGLATLREKYASVVFDVTTAKGIAEARAARMEIREPRYELEHIRKEAKRPILDLGKKLDSEAERITAELLKIEEPIDSQIKAQEKQIEDERTARAEAERQRVAAIQVRIDAIRDLASDAVGMESSVIGERILALEEMPIGEDFAELQQQAEGARATTLIRLRVAYTAAVAAETEAQRLEAERVELTRQREADAAERARVAEETRLATERREAEERQARKVREAEEARAEEQRRIRRELDDREAEQRRKVLADQEAAAKHERDAESARQEAQRHQNEMRMSEISGIHQQVMIATLGRQGVRKGGTLECYEQTLAETEAWPIEESNFGPMTPMAQKAKDSAIASIRLGLATFKQRAADKAESDRIAADRAELQRQQAELAKAREPAPSVEPAPQPVTALPMTHHPGWRPKATFLVNAVAEHYDVDRQTALRWLRSTDFSKVEAQESAA